MRAFLLGLVTLFVLLALALLVVPGFIDWQAARPRLEAQISHIMGREVSIDGSLSVSVLPRPLLVAEGLRVANRDQGSEPEMLRVAHLEMRVAPLPLFSGRFDVQSLRLTRPLLLVERLPDGSGNWQKAGASGAGSPVNGLISGISLDAVEVRDGELVWRDHEKGREERFSGIDALLTAQSLRGPLSTQGRLLYREREVLFDLSLGAPNQRARQELDLQVALPEAAGAELRMSAWLDRNEQSPRLAGRLRLRGADTAALLHELGSAPATFLRLEQPLSATATVNWAAGRLDLDDIDLVLGEDGRLGGSFRYSSETSQRLEGRLAARYLDLDPFIAEGLSEWPRFSLPQELEAQVSLEVERLGLRGETVRNLGIEARLDSGTLAVERAEAELPGGGEAALDGRWYDEAGKPRFKGKFEARSSNLRAQLAWLGLEPEGVDDDRLRRFGLMAKLDARPGLITVTDADFHLDLSRGKGGFALAPRRRPGLGLRLSLDRLNLDAYTEPETLPATSLLNDFDANLDLSIGRFELAGRQAQELRMAGRLQGGELDLRELSMAKFAGARLWAAGHFFDLDHSVPTARDLSLELETEDTGPLLQELGLQTFGILSRLGGLSLAGTMSGGSEGGEVNLDIEARDASAVLVAQLEKGNGGLRIAEGKFDLVDLRVEEVADLFGYRLAPSQKGPGRLALKSSFTGDGAHLEHDTRILLDDGVLRLNGYGQEIGSDNWRGAGDLELRHPDAAALWAQITGQEGLSPPQPARLEGQANFSSAGWTLENLEGEVGGTPLEGEASWTAGPSAALDLELELGVLQADAWSGLLVGAGFSPGALFEGGRWSRSLFSRSLLSGPDLALDLSLRQLDLGESTLEGVSLELARKEEVLEVSAFEGRLDNGWIEAEGRLSRHDTRWLQAGLRLEGKGLPADLLWDRFDPEFSLGGQVDLSLDVDGSGRNAAHLVGSLTGQGELAGVLNLRPDESSEVDESAPLRSLISELRSDLMPLTGNLEVEAGRVRARGIRLEGDDRVLELRGILADLPRLHTDFNARLEDVVEGRDLAVLEVAGPLSNPESDLRFLELNEAEVPSVTPASVLSPAGAEPRRP